MGHHNEALPLLQRHLSQCEDSPSVDPARLAQARVLLGACLLGQEELEQAADLLLEGYEGLPDTPGGIVDQRIRAATWLVQVFDAMEWPNDAAHWRSILEELGGEGAR